MVKEYTTCLITYYGQPVRLLPLYRRSAFQVALLTVVTSGLYYYYWAYRVRRWTSTAIERPDDGILKTLGLVVPALNLVLMHDLGMLIEATANRAREPFRLGWLPWAGASIPLFYFLGLLPWPFGMLSILFVVPITAMHVPFAYAQIGLSEDEAWPTRFSWFEWFLIVGGVLWHILIVTGLFLPRHNGSYYPFPAFGALLYCAIALALAIFATWDRRRIDIALHNRDVPASRAVAH